MILAVFPHQLYANHPGLEFDPERIVLIEEALFFGDTYHPVRFHQQKLWLHRATMKRFEADLLEKGQPVGYVEYDPSPKALGQALQRAFGQTRSQDRTLVVVDPTDFLLEKRLRRLAESQGFELRLLPSPSFLNSREENLEYRAGKKRWFMADFYRWQRKRLDILMEGDQPAKGQWSFDKDNRKKVPKNTLDSLPTLLAIKRDEIDREAKAYVGRRFSQHPGSLDRLYYPTSHRSARQWLKHFLVNRLELFGDYEDAIVDGESWLWHSVLTPSLNIGLLTPQDVLETTLAHAEQNDVPLNSLEGFLRQLIGWREFMRATYEDLGVPMRTTNHWAHHRAMPSSFYDGTTGVAPIDDTIHRIIQTGYCHHIERLMVLGGFMFLCEINPDEIYRWFMEMFIDSYDWVMVPNVYAMSQHSDGGLITTKPYFSGASYVRKMSHHKKADWCDVWDGLYWRWIWNHVDDLAKNPRWAMMCSMARKMEPTKRARHMENAEAFLRAMELSTA